MAASRQQQMARLLAEKGDRRRPPAAPPREPRRSPRRPRSGRRSRRPAAARSPTASITARATPSTGRVSPAPKMPSTTRLAPSSAAGASASTAPGQRAAASAASPRSAATRAEQRHPHRPAALGQHARRDKTVAAVVPRPAEDDERPRRPAPRDRVGDAAAGVLHQRDAGNAAGDRQPIRLAHLLRRQQRELAPTRGRNRHRRNVGRSQRGGNPAKPDLDAPPANRYLQRRRRV